MIRDWKMGGAQMGNLFRISRAPRYREPSKIIKPIDPSEPEKAQIGIEGGEDLYREIRVPNTFKDKRAKK